MSARKTLLRSHHFIFYLVNDRSPRHAKFPSVVLIDIERVFFNFNHFSYSSPCVMVNVGDDFGIFQENVVFGGSGVFCKCRILYSSMSESTNGIKLLNLNLCSSIKSEVEKP